MANVGNSWTLVRLKDISGGFAPDDDWVTTQDIAGWEATDPLWYVPNQHRAQAGHFQLMVSFYDDLSTNVPATASTRVDIQPVSIVEGAGVPSRLIDLGVELAIPGDDVEKAPEPLAFPDRVGLRVLAGTSLPTANFLAVLARLV